LFSKIIEKISLNKNISIIYKNIHDNEIKILEKNNFIFYKKIIGVDRDYFIYKN
jgi:hypothetical protein